PPGRGAGGTLLGGPAGRARLALAAGPGRQPLVSLPPTLPAGEARRLGPRLSAHRRRAAPGGTGAGPVRAGADRGAGMNKLKQCRHGLMVYQPNDRYIGRSLELYGEFSEAEVDLFAGLVGPGDTAVDVGAN